MKTPLHAGLVALLASSISIIAAESGPKAEVTQAAKALGEKPNYSWRATVHVPESAQFRPGPTEGKVEKDGYTQVSMSFGENTTQAFIKGDKAAVTNRDGEWQSAAELENAEGPGRFLAAIVRNIQPPSVQAAELASHTKELKQDGDAYSGELTEDGAKRYISLRRRSATGGGGPNILSAKGSVKFWLKNGALAKYEYKVDGAMEFNGNEIEIVRTTSVEIKEVGATKIDIPEAAKKKLM